MRLQAPGRTALLLACMVLLASACGGQGDGRRVQITVLTGASPSPETGVSGVTAPFGAAVQPTPPPITLTGAYRIAVPAVMQQDMASALQDLATVYPRLKLSLTPLAGGEPAAQSGADLAINLLLPGEFSREHGVVLRRQPLAIELPLTLSPDDLTLPQAVDLLTGAVSDWAQVGGQRRPVRLAFSEPAVLAYVGGMAGKPRASLAPARTDTMVTLLAEVDGGADEAVVVPWQGPRLHSKPLRIDGHFPDDVEYPLVTLTTLTALKREAATLADQLGPVLALRFVPSRAGSVAIDAMGDLMLARGVAAMVQKHGAGWPFAEVMGRLRAADVRYGNLEFALTDRGTQAHKDFTFRAPSTAVESLAQAGINVVGLANNHILDYGAQGLTDTIADLAGADITHTGAGADAESAHAALITAINGVRVAWLAYANVPDDGVTGFVARSLEAGPGHAGVAWGTPEAIRRDVLLARARADIVIVALHAGFEYTAEPNSIQRDLAHAAIDAGAALVLGAHPHVLQGLEFYKGGLIAYSLGNFVFDLDGADLAQYGLPSVLTLILRVQLDASGVTGIEVYPAIINRTDFRPEPVSGEAARPVYDRLYRLTEALRRPLR